MKYWKVSGYLLYAVLLFGYLWLANCLAAALTRYNSRLSEILCV